MGHTDCLDKKGIKKILSAVTCLIFFLSSQCSFFVLNFLSGARLNLEWLGLCGAGSSAQADVRRPVDCCAASSAVPRSIVYYRRCYDA